MSAHIDTQSGILIYVSCHYSYCKRISYLMVTSFEIISTASPNAVQEVEKLQKLLEAEKEKGRIREETISLLKDDKTYLQGEVGKKDELIHQLLSKKDDDNSTIMSGKSSE